MKTLLKFTLRILFNSLGIYLSARYITGFHFVGDWGQLLLVGLVLMILNLILKPILKLILSPIIILTLGLGLILINAGILYLLDILSPALSIEGTLPLLMAGILFSVLNFVFHFIL